MRTNNIVYLNEKKVEKHTETTMSHNILRPQNLITAIAKQKKNRIITKYGYKKYRNKLTQADKCNIKERHNPNKL